MGGGVDYQVDHIVGRFAASLSNGVCRTNFLSGLVPTVKHIGSVNVWDEVSEIFCYD